MLSLYIRCTASVQKPLYENYKQEEKLLLPVFSIHLQAYDRTDEHGTVHVLIVVSLGVPSLSLPFWVIGQIQLLYVLT